ncbi:hypothetical protein N7493_003434 [Penicillium malachiteum]|uniref:Uncharacterized protein n=1 Tax=Penicillium malachiteum TaxID=1324776 RepID=A0AAD6HPP7_9EURO|nr:hypothetical protein N7493_003434 [Penicillium malachiteum]
MAQTENPNLTDKPYQQADQSSEPLTETKAPDPITETEGPKLAYEPYQATGQLFQRLMETKAPDPITEADAVYQGLLELKDLSTFDPKTYPCDLGHGCNVCQPMDKVGVVPKLIQDQAQAIDIEPITNNTFLKVIAEERVVEGTGPGISFSNYWEGIVAPGALFIEHISRNDGPFSSEISRLMYGQHFPPESLKHVFILNVINPHTKPLITDQIYAPHNGLQWPDTEPRVWRRGTPEYEAILGTKLGRFVARIVIGSFEPGSRRIAQIFTWCHRRLLQLRFDIQLESSCDNLPLKPPSGDDV